jgi:hypothetical protein
VTSCVRRREHWCLFTPFGVCLINRPKDKNGTYQNLSDKEFLQLISFLGFQTSGELFDRFAKEIRERINLVMKAVGTIRVDEIYAVAPPEPGKKIA